MLKGHPKGLLVLFFANMGERFGYYTMLAIFVLYLQEFYGWDASTAGNVYGAFLFGIYAMPLLGGWLADKVWGYGRTIITGTIIMALGYALMAVPGMSKWVLFAALAVISIGNGMFKGNLVVLVGNLYDKKDFQPLRDRAFNIFYMGINIGAFFAPHAARGIKDIIHQDLGYTLAQGYNAAFGLAGISMIISLLIFVAFKKYYADVDFRHHEKPHDPDAVVLTKEQEKERITALMIVFGIVVFFWMTFHQNGFTMTLFAKNYTIHQVGPLTYMFFDLAAFLAVIAVIAGLVLVVNPRIKASGRYIGLALMIVGGVVAWYKYTSFSALNDAPPELYLSFNPVFIVFLTPVIVGLFAWLHRKGKEPSSPAKIGIGMVLAGAAFFILVLASWGLPSVSALNGGRSPELVGPFWLISAYFTITIAELFLSPMGLSFVSKVSPPRLKGQMQGGWLAATAIGNGLAGLIGHFYENWQLWEFFGLLVCTSLLSAIMVLAVLKRLKRATES